MSFFGSRRQSDPPQPPTPAGKPDQPTQPPSAPPAPVGFETVLGANSTIEGTLRSSANIRLDGTFSGNLEITGNVLVGETAKINADINARNISIAGAVRGNISGKKVQLLRTGRVWGDIRAAALTTEEGAFIDGKITMIPNESGGAPVVPPEASPADDEPAAATESGKVMSMSEREHPDTPRDAETSNPPVSPTGSSQPADYERQVERVMPVGLGATEEDPDDMQHAPGEPPIGTDDHPDVANISQDDAAMLPVQTDSNEGQANEDPTRETPRGADDETRQST